jgi:hypothetical protein
VADLHIGAPTFNEKKALKHRKYILDDPNRKAIDLGDHCENALRDSPGTAVLCQKLSPSEQREYAAWYYGPIADRVLAIVHSNHSARSVKAADISPDELLALRIGCARLVEGTIFITVGDSRRGQQYAIYVRHSVGNCTTKSALVNGLQRQTWYNQGNDVYWCAHSHSFLHVPQTVTVPDPRHGKVKKIIQHLCCSDSFMEYDDSYAQTANHQRPTPGQVSLRLYLDRHHVEVLQLVY